MGWEGETHQCHCSCEYNSLYLCRGGREGERERERGIRVGGENRVKGGTHTRSLHTGSNNEFRRKCYAN